LPVSEDQQPEVVEEESAGARGTSVNTALASLIGLAATAVFYLILRLPGIRGGYLYRLFVERSIIQYATAAFFFWGLAFLVLKHRRIRVEQKALELDLLSIEPSQLIRQEDALHYIRKIKRLSPADRGRLLTNRIWHALTRFKLLGSAEKVDDLLKYQGEIDAANMESSYSFLKFAVALVPILGFLGTVLGISLAVANFSDVIGSAGDLSKIKDALQGVTLGLGTAFDTTLVALVMSAILMLGLTTFQRTEELMLGRVEDYCLEDLLAHLWVPPEHEQFQAALTRALSPLPTEIARELKKLMDQSASDHETT